MRTQRTAGAVSFDIWTAQRTWFWSLVYPDRHGGIIGAASSEAEAVGEAQAVIERLPQRCVETPAASGNEAGFSAPLPSSQVSRLQAGFKVDHATDDFAPSHAWQTECLTSRTIGKGYDNLWRLTLARYAAQVALHHSM